MSTHKRLVDKLEVLMSDVPVEEISKAMSSRQSLVQILDRAENTDLHELHMLTDMREKELGQEREANGNRRNIYSLFGNLSGAAIGAVAGFVQEPLESVRAFVYRAILSGSNEINPAYAQHLRGEFSDNLNYTIDQASRLPGAVIGGILGWIVIGYLARKMFDRKPAVRSTENQYYMTQELKLCSREVIERRYGK